MGIFPIYFLFTAIRISFDTSIHNVYTIRFIKMSFKEMTTVDMTIYIYIYIYIEYSAYKIL